jgi:glycosyltransferase involved in cell wall biosynthesis
MTILYVSYDGALEPLGESQVVAYLELLARRHTLTLLSFEKRRDLGDVGRVDVLRHRLAAAGVRWLALPYHRRPPVLSTAWDVARGIVVALREGRRRRIHVTHARGYVAALVALTLRRLVGARFIFDMRGFWADEKVDAAHWRAGCALYRVTKRCERRFFESADAIVSLTAAGLAAARRLGYGIGPDAAVEVIPTCTDLRRFCPGPRDAALAARLDLGPGPVIGCVGSLSNAYLRRPMLDYLACVTAALPTLTVLVVTHEDHHALYAEAIAAGVPADRLRITRAAFSTMPLHLRLMDLGVFFIRPTFAGLGRAATKLGEFLGSGVPVVINDGIGDSGRIVRDEGAGVVLPDVKPERFASSLPAVRALLEDPGVRRRCRVAAERWFDLDAGVQRYASLYARLDLAARDPAPEPGATRRPA